MQDDTSPLPSFSLENEFLLSSQSSIASTGNPKAPTKRGKNVFYPSNNLLQLLKNRNDLTKICEMYISITSISKSKHTILCVAGMWSFLEVIARRLGMQTGNFSGFLNGFLNQGSLASQISQQDKKAVRQALEDILNAGNLNKHAAFYAACNESQIEKSWTTIIPALELLIPEIPKP